MSISRQDKPDILSEDESFIQRWSRRKQNADQDAPSQPESIPVSNEADNKSQLTDADMPAIDSLTEDSDYSGFLSPRVSEALRKQALRKLFHSTIFNIRDGLDDYDGVYTEFEKLGDIVTADMRHQIEMDAERHARQVLEKETDQTEDQNETAVATSTSDPLNAIEAEQDDVATQQATDAFDDTEVES